MRVLVCGGRDFDDGTYMCAVLDEVAPGTDTEIIHGGAQGADFHASQIAEDDGLQVTCFPADWEEHGRAAGPIRNQQMLDEGKPDLVLAFAGGRGTDSMCQLARIAGVEVRRYWPGK